MTEPILARGFHEGTSALAADGRRRTGLSTYRAIEVEALMGD